MRTRLKFCNDRFEGTDANVTIPGAIPINAHTHPQKLYGQLRYHPPSETDYIEAIWSAMRHIEWECVVEPSGTWAYRPTESLMDRIFEKQPNIAMDVGPGLAIGQTSASMYVNAEISDILDAIANNTSTDGVALSQPSEHLAEIRADNAGKLPDGFAPISVEQYIHNIGMALDGDKAGFEVLHFPGTSDVVLPLKWQHPRWFDAWNFSVPYEDNEKNAWCPAKKDSTSCRATRYCKWENDRCRAKDYVTEQIISPDYEWMPQMQGGRLFNGRANRSSKRRRRSSKTRRRHSSKKRLRSRRSRVR